MKGILARHFNARRVCVLLHRYVGLSIALFLMLAAVTGIALAFFNELDRGLNPRLYIVEERGIPTLAIDGLVQRIGQQYPHAFINLLTLNRHSGESVRVQLTARVAGEVADPAQHWTEIFVDAFDGRVLGGRERGAFHVDRAHLMPFIYRLHETLALPEPWGRWLMGSMALVWLLDNFVGFYLTLPARTKNAAPRKGWWLRWQSAWLVKFGASLHRVIYDAHRAAGLWLWIVLAVMALSSVFFNLKHEVFRPTLARMAPLTPDTYKTLAAMPQARVAPRLSFSDVLARAQQLRSPSTRDMELSYIGRMADAPGTYRVRYAERGRGDVSNHFRYENLFIDGTDGTLLARVSYYEGTAADRLLLWQYPLHSGQVLGIAGRIFIAATGIVVALLIVTGVAIWVRKRFGWRRRGADLYRRAADIEDAATLSTGVQS